MTLQHLSQQWWPQRLANRLALASALQLLLVAGSLSLLSFAIGRRSGLEIGETYRQNASVVELSTRLSRKLSYPRWINDLNLLKLRNSPGDQLDYAYLTEVFWREMQVFPVDYINYGGANGEFIGMERTRDGVLLLNEDTSRSGRGSMAVYRMRDNGTPGPLLERIPDMSETHQEAWYTDTVRAGKPTWSSIYSWEDQPDVFSISYNAPLYGPGGKLRGVVGVDVVLSQLSSWLEGVWRQRTGLALIVEPSGDLVASSKPRYTLSGQGDSLRRSSLSGLSDPLVRDLTRRYFQPAGDGRLRLKPGSLKASSKPERVQIGARLYTVAASPWGREEGLNWILLTALAADPSTTRTEHTVLAALLAAAAALALAVLLTNRQIRALLRPLRQLEDASDRLSYSLAQGQSGDLSFVSGIPTSAGEELTALDSAIRELVERFNRATLELQQLMERERYRDAQTLALLKDKLSSSLQAAAVAHEINQPLSVLLLNCQLLLRQAAADPQAAALPDAMRDQLRSIGDEANRVVHTIEKMRTLLRNVQTEHRRIDLREVARSAVLYARSATAASQLGLDSSNLEQTASSPAWIEGDAAQIQIAIVNLLRNAAEALQEQGQAAPWIGVQLQRAGDWWHLSVADNGPGFSGEEADATPLHTTKASGSGLGLFVVRTTMDNHRGRVELGRSPAGGAMATLVFRAL